ncbi:MAG: RNA-binding protein [Halobacteriales archaeon]
MEVKSRHHLRQDAVEELQSTLVDDLGVEPPPGAYELVELEDGPFDVVLIDGEPYVFYVEGEPFLTVRGANALEPTRLTVTVDAGAIQFVSDGADVMRPGIVEADEAIRPGDLVVVVEETHGKALAIGRSRVAGSDLLGPEGKVVDTVHHVGDELYGFDP